MLLPRVIGMKAAKKIILLGEDNITSSTALELGIISEVTTNDRLLKRSKVAKHISVIDPILVKNTKKAINQTFEIAGLHEALEKSLEIDFLIDPKDHQTKEFWKLPEKRE